MAHDTLSDALAAIDARCVVSGGFTAGGTWGLRFWPSARLKVVAVVRGACWLTVEGHGPPLLLEAGDVAVLNGWPQVVLADSPTSPVRVVGEDIVRGRGNILALSGSDEVAVIGGHLEVDRMGEALLLDALPVVTRIGRGEREAAAIGFLLERILGEMTDQAPAAETALRLHAQLLMIEVFRAVLAEAGSYPAGWFRLLADERLAPAVSALHREPSKAWSLEELARLSAMSRTTFVQHFKATAGAPPIQYLQAWRIRLAERSLRIGDAPVKEIAASLGFGSESAFSTSFKRSIGVSPRNYRRSASAEI